MSLTTRTESWFARDARRYFSTLPLPRVAPSGVWDGRLVGRPGLVRLAVATSFATPFRGWCGKEFRHDGSVQNFSLRGGRWVPTVRGRLVHGTSLLDGIQALVVDYRDTAPPPYRWMRGEVRLYGDGPDLMGMLFLPVAGRPVLGPFPFLLTRRQG